MHTDRLKSILDPWDRPGSPGCALAIVRRGQPAVVRCAGLASIEHDVPIVADTVFHAASLAKQFTATAVHLLSVEGRLSLEDPIQRFVPELPECCRSIRLRHLIHHTSGLRDQWDLLFLAGWRPEDVVTTEDVLTLLQRQTDLNFPPGEEHLYCNTGYTLLALAVERVAGQSLDHFCQERLFAPTQMSNTRFQHDHTVIASRRAASYTAQAGGDFRTSGLSYSLAGATNLLTTIEDLGVWEQAVHNGILADLGLGETVYAAGVITDGGSTCYGAGLRLSRILEKPVAYHNGVDAGFRCHFIRFPSNGISVAVLGNVSNLFPAELARQAADIALDGFSGYAAKDASPPLPTMEVAGVYWDEETGLGCEVQRIGDLLFYRGYGYFPMVAETGYGFSLKGYPEMRLSFTAEAGKVYLLEQPPGSPPASFIRTCPDGEFAFPLQYYEGAYVCSQINAEYRVVTDDGGLRIMSLKNRSAPLRWVGPDRGVCSWNECGGAPNWVFSIRFERDAAGGVVGFSLSTARTRRLFFRHIDTATVKSPPFFGHTPKPII